MERKIRILHVAQAAGGVERYIKMLLKYMESDKFENILICSQDYSLDKFKEVADRLDQIKMEREIGIHDLKTAKELRKKFKEYKPDVIYAHSSKAGAIARIANIGLHSKCIYNPHGWAFNMKCSTKKQFLYTYIEKMLAALCDKIICISEAEKRSAIEKKICKKEKLQVIFNGVDFEQCELSEQEGIQRASLDIPENAFVVGMVGRLSPQKAPDMFTQVAKLVKQSIPDAYFVIVGSGEMEKEIRQYAVENGLKDSLYITGWVDDPLSYMKIFDVACLFSKWEGFGLVLPEYMLMKKPIVATNVDAIPDIIKDGENGLLIDSGDIQGGFEAILKIYSDDNLKNTLITGGTKSLKRFDVRRVSLEHQDLFEKTMQSME